MAMSLEKLLAEEGFKRRKAKAIPRLSSASEGRSMGRYMESTKHQSGPLMAVKRTERTRSDIPWRNSKGEFSTSSSFTGMKPRENLLRRGKMEMESEETSLKHEIEVGYEDYRGSEITEVVQRDEIVEVGINKPYKDIYSNKVYGQDRNEEMEKNIMVAKKNMNNSLRCSRKSMKQAQGFEKKSSRKFENDKIFDESRSISQNKFEEVLATPALDEAAVKAIISILSGYVKRFAMDEEFRTSLHHNSFASLYFIGLDEGLNTESKVIENLEQAIEVVERAAEEIASLKELKKASLQLSVITGLNSNDLKDGFTSGIPNFKLSACAHLYLSVIYMLQKKDKITAKYLLQVFCDSPFQARKILLPDLWDHVFLPHLIHLKLWYDNEARSLSDSPVLNNQKLLEKVYNERLDSGTYQFAVYYKDWITEAVEVPSIPLIKIPSFSAQLMPHGGLHGHTSSPNTHLSPLPMVSKKLYDEVFKRSQKSGVELEVYEEENFDVSGKSSNSPATEDKQLILYSHDTNQSDDPDSESINDNPPVAEETQKLHPESSSAVPNTDENHGLVLSHAKENKVFDEKQIDEQQENYDDLREKSHPFSVPKDFICPLTGLLFEDPVTLETGQTFERKAITDWFGQGWLTCPVTRKTLQCQEVPFTNLILKRVIDNWKTEHFSHLLLLLAENIEVNDNMSVCIIDQLLAVFSKEERIMNATRILSLGGLEFLLRRFQCGNTEEKTFILPLFSCCIEADAGCRNNIARNINKSYLLELLRIEELKLKTHAVLLLNELICLNRRNAAKCFLEGLLDEEIMNAMDDLLIYLHSCPLEQRPLVAVLLLNLDLLSGQHGSDIYRWEAVDALTTTLERSLYDEKVEKKCSRALLVLGGFFSSSGKLMTEDWILKLTGFLNGPDWDIVDYESDDIAVDARVMMVNSRSEDKDEENARDKWLVSLSASLLGDGKKSFLDTVSKCLSLGNSNLVRVCLTTTAWFSSSLSDTEFQLYAFSTLISPLKQCLEHGELVEHRILASLSLLNSSRTPECRALLMTIGEEIESCLEDLAEVTWTAKELYAIISGLRR